jgi:hypothetical protein
MVGCSPVLLLLCMLMVPVLLAVAKLSVILQRLLPTLLLFCEAMLTRQRKCRCFLANVCCAGCRERVF